MKAPRSLLLLTSGIQAVLLGAVLGFLVSCPATASPIVQRWVQRHTNVQQGNGNAVAVDAKGDIIVTGGSGPYETNGDFYTAKYLGEGGALIWERTYNGPNNGFDGGAALALDANGNVIVTGASKNGSYDFYTAKYAATDGALLWEKSYAGPGGDAFPSGIAVDANGNVIVAGQSLGTASGYDFYVAKYAAATGALIWEKRYNGPANGEDIARAVAVDASGNVVVTGSSAGTGSGLDYYTAKYAATDGALLWEKRYNGTGNVDDIARALALDANGNVIVTGSSAGTGSGFDYYTAKYAAIDGALLWEKRYNRPANANDYAYAVGTDGAGNVFVTGSSYNGATTLDDIYTAKYAAADGALLWEKVYNGPGSGNDQGHSLAVDSAGDLLVAGYSGGVGTDADYCLLKYAGADGTQLWEQHYNGVGYNGNGQGPDIIGGVHQLAITPDGGAVITGYSYGLLHNDFTTVRYGPPDVTTLPPTLTSPATESSNGPTLAVDFALGEDASPGTVTLTFAGPAVSTLTLVDADASSGRHTFNLPAASLNTSPDVAAVNGATALPAGLYSVILSYQDVAENPAAVAVSSNVTIEFTPPSLTPVTIASNNANSLYAKLGNTTTLTFTASEAIQTPVVTITGQTASVTNPSGNLWQATLSVGGTTTQGKASFSITATDLVGNTAAPVTNTTNGSSVTVDRTAPTLTVPATQVAEATGAAGAIVNYPAATATDVNLSSVTYSKNSGTVFPLGNTTVTATATDSAGNLTSKNFTVTVQDTTPPAITILGTNPVTVEAAIPYSDAGATATDIVVGDVTASLQVIGSVNVNAVGDYTLTYRATDGVNVAMASRTVKVRDTTPPVVTILGTNPAVVEAGTAYNDAGATASDTLAGNLSGAIQTTSNVNPNAIGDYAVTYRVSDGVNLTTVNRTVQVRDTTPPVIAILGENPVTVTEWPYNDPGATANDSFAGNLTNALQTQSNVNARVVGDYSVTYTVSDGHNTAVATRTVKVRDIAPPEITILGPNPAIVEAGSAYNDAGATASDTLAGELTAAIQTASTVNARVVGEYEVNYSVTDGTYTAHATRTVQVVDTTGPVITHVPAAVATRADETNHALVPDFSPDLTVTDNVGVTQTTQDPPAGTEVGFGSHAITLTIEDAAHNISSCTTTFTVLDGPALPGRYAGLLADTQGAVHAYLELQLTRKQVLTGMLLLDNGQRLEMPRKILPASLTGQLTLNRELSLALVFDGFGHAAAKLTGNGISLSADAILGATTAPDGVPGNYTAIIEPNDGSAPGWLYETVSVTGRIRSTGILPNGSTVGVNQGGIVDRHGNALIFLVGKRHALLAGLVQFEGLPGSDFAGSPAFQGSPCTVQGAKFTPAASALPSGAYPLALSGGGLNVSSTVTLLGNNTADVLAPVSSLLPLPRPNRPANGLFTISFRNPATPFEALLKGTGIFHQKLGIGVGQFRAGTAVGRVEFGMQ